MFDFWGGGVFGGALEAVGESGGDEIRERDVDEGGEVEECELDEVG